MIKTNEKVCSLLTRSSQCSERYNYSYKPCANDFTENMLELWKTGMRVYRKDRDRLEEELEELV
jgi:hypothetical protein